MFDFPEFKQWAGDLDAGLEDSRLAPELDCPACGHRMIKSVGLRKLAGYICSSGSECVGVQFSIEDLTDGERYKIVVSDCLARKKRFEDMRTRNGYRDWTMISEEERPRLPFCGTCKGNHPPSEEHPLCKLCGHNVVHELAPADLFFDFKGWRFRAPFHCMCCGAEICYRQWAFGRSCGTCDTGYCRKNHSHQMDSGVFCAAGTELVDPKADHCFDPERMKPIPPNKPLVWRQHERIQGKR